MHTSAFRERRPERTSPRVYAPRVQEIELPLGPARGLSGNQDTHSISLVQPGCTSLVNVATQRKTEKEPTIELLLERCLGLEGGKVNNVTAKSGGRRPES